MLFMALRALNDREVPWGLKALGYIMIGSLLIRFKIPPLSNLLIHLPIIKQLNNTIYNPEFYLALGVLASAGLQQTLALARQSREQRIAASKSALLYICVFLSAYVVAQPLRGVVAQYFPTGIKPKITQGGAQLAGGIMGPERLISHRRTYTLSGWVPSFPPASRIFVHAVVGGQKKTTVKAVISPRGSRQYFHAQCPLPAGMGPLLLAAEIQYSDGTQRMLIGPQITVRDPPAALYWFFAFVLFFPCLLLFGSWLVKPMALGLMLVCFTFFTVDPFPAEQIPFKLPGIAKIKKDPTRFRISAFNHNFLSADYANLYGLEDIRNGGDLIDVLSLIYFIFFSQSYLQQSNNPAVHELGLKLLGLANVKYILDFPEAQRTHPGLKRIYHGREMSIYRNKHFLPRAMFFEKALSVPLGNFKDWRNRGRIFGAFAGVLQRPGFDLRKTLIINEPFGRPPPPASAPAKEKSPLVRIEEYKPNRIRVAVNTTRPGFLFLSDNYFPDWKARLNGVPVAILRSWMTFRAVRVPSGSSSIEFVYRPRRLHATVLLTLCLSLGWLFCYFRYRPGKGPETLFHPPKKKPEKKKDAQVLALSEEVVTSTYCAQWTELLVVGVVGAEMLFWAFWSAFLYQGGILTNWNRSGYGTFVNGTACLLLVGLAARAIRSYSEKRREDPPLSGNTGPSRP